MSSPMHFSKQTSQHGSLNVGQFITFESFFNIFCASLGYSHYEFLIEPNFTDICSGWKQDTFKQVAGKMTKNGSQPMPLVFNSTQQMQCVSNKTEALQNIFNHLNYQKLDRIDAQQFIACILTSIDGKFESFIKNVVLIFGYQEANTITQPEFENFMDNMCCGVMNIVTPPELILNKAEK